MDKPEAMLHGKNGGERFEDVYPPIEGWVWSSHRNGEIYHSGYMTEQAKKCSCGYSPVFEQFVMDMNGTSRNVPATKFIAICPKCERRAPGYGTLEEVLTAWNLGARTKDGLMLQKKLTDPEGNAVKSLSDAVVKDAVQKTVQLILRKRQVMEMLNDKQIGDMKREVLYTELKTIRSKLTEMQDFFEESPILYDKDSDAMLSGIRKIVFPDLSHEERVKIPLKLVRM